MTFCVPPVTAETSSSGPWPSPWSDIQSATDFRSTSSTWQNLLRVCWTGRTSAIWLRGVPHGLDPDHAVPEHEGIDTVVNPVDHRVGGPLEEEDVAVENLCPQVPGCIGQIVEQFDKHLPDAVLAARCAGRREDDGIVGVVGGDLVEVARGERLAVVGEYFLWCPRPAHSTPLQNLSTVWEKA